MSIRTPNYILTEEISVSNCDGRQSRTLPAGAFVRPIEPSYVPKHILDTPSGKYFDPKREVFVFTRYGIFVVPRTILREV